MNFEIVDCMIRSASNVEEKGSSLSSSIVFVIRFNMRGSSDTCANDS